MPGKSSEERRSLSFNPGSLLLFLPFLLLNAFFCLLLFLLISRTVQTVLMNSRLLIGVDNRDRFVPQFLINVNAPGMTREARRGEASRGEARHRPSPLARGFVVTCERHERLAFRNLVYVFGQW